MTGNRLNVLGPLALTIDGVTVDVTRAKVRAALTLFAARSDAPLSTDALIDHLWPTSIPKDPRAALSVVLSRLRQALGPARDALTVTNGAHRLDIETDMGEFSQLVAAARKSTDTEHAASLLDQALNLWRGEPFEDELAGAHIGSVATGLVEQRWDAIALRAEALFDLAEYDSLVAFGLPLALEQPHRERLIASCARALGLVGRKTDGLRLIEQSRSWLRNEMGLDASVALDKLEQDLLTGAVDLVHSKTGRSNPEATTPFVNRTSELDALHDRSAALLITGEAGIGKTALLARAKQHWHQAGRHVFTTSAPASSARPLEALTDLLVDLTDVAAPGVDEPELWTSLARVVPSISAPVTPDRSVVTKDTLVSALSAYIERTAVRMNAVIVIDDVHWLDLTSAEVIARIARRNRAALVAVGRPILTGPLVDLHDTGIDQIGLGPLDLEHVREAVQLSSRDDRAGDVSTQLWHRTGGNPLFLHLLLDMMNDGVDIASELPATVLVAVQQRLEVLSRRARQTLERAALVGARFSLSTLRQLTPTADADLDECVAAGLVNHIAVSDEAEFSHALVQEGVRDLIAEGHRISLHDQIGQILEFSGAPASAYVAHYEAAAALDPLRATRALFDAASEFASVFAWQDVYAYTSRAFDHYLPSGDDLLDARLAVLQGNAQRDLHRGGSDEPLQAAIDTARAFQDDELFAEAVIAHCVHGWEIDAEASRQPVDLIDEALALDVSTENRILLSAAGATLMQSEHHERGRLLYRQALDEVRNHDDVSLQARVLQMAHWGLSHPEDLTAFSEATRLFRTVAGNDPTLRWEAATTEFAFGIISIDPDLVATAMTELRALVADAGPSPKDWELAHTEASYAHLRGELDLAHEHLERSRRLGLETTSESWVLPIYGALLMALLPEEGRLGEVLGLFDSAIASNPGFTGWHSAAAAAAASNGDVDRARHELAFVLRERGPAALRPAIWTGETALLCAAAATVGDDGFARQLYDLVAPFSGRMSWSGVSTNGPTDRGLSALAAVLGDNDLAEHHRGLADQATNAFRSMPA